MYHSVTIGDKNTYDDWHLVPDGRPVIAMPEIKTNMIEVPGASGSIDASELLTKYPLYSNRKGDLKFIVLNDYGEWQDRYTEIANYVHGKKLKLVLEDDPDYYYEGRFSLDKWESKNDGTWSIITFKYELDPYKYRKNTTIYNFTLSSQATSATGHTFPTEDIGSMPTIPIFEITNIGSNGISIIFRNSEIYGQGSTNSIARNNKKHTFYDMVCTNLSGTNDTNRVVMSGSGNVKIIIQTGDL